VALQVSGYQNVPLAVILTILCVSALLYWTATHESAKRWGVGLYARYGARYPTMTLLVAIISGALIGGMIGGGSYIFFKNLYGQEKSTSRIAEIQPFSVDIETTLFAPSRDKACGFYLVYPSLHGETISPANAAIFLRLINLQSVPSMISKYGVEIKINDRWEKALKLDTRVAVIYVAFGGLNKAIPLREDTLLFDRFLSNHNLQPREVIRGWVLIEYPKSAGQVKPEFRVTVSDVAGASYVSGPLMSKADSTNDAAQAATFSVGDKKTIRDLSNTHVTYYSEWVR
jgi:hypothetical protein